MSVVDVLGLLPYASNATLLARLDSGELVVYKPDQGERPLWDFAHGSLGSREVLTYETAAAMGEGGLVPETWVADGPLGRGSAQKYVSEDFDFDAAALVRPVMHPWTWAVAVLDIVTNNADRKFGHLIRDEDTGGYWAIDNGLTFHAEDKLRTVLWGHSGCSLPAAQRSSLDLLAAAADEWLARRVESLLSPAEAGAFVGRIEQLRDEPVHPHPPVDRPAVPWPIY